MVRLNLASSLAAAVAFSGLSAHAIPLAGSEGESSPAAHLVSRDAPTSIPSGFRRRVFLENFVANSALSQTTWQYDLGTSYPGGPPQWGTWEVQRYTSDRSNILINGAGNLQIIPRKNSQTGEWTSSRIETKPVADFQCVDGGKIRVQASIRLGTGFTTQGANDGFWPAFWLLSPAFRGNYMSWPTTGELDILESVNGLPTAWNVAHCGTNPGGVCNEPNGLGGSTPMTRGVFNTYRLDIDRTAADWRQETIRWYLNDRLTRTLTPRDMQYNQDAWNSLVHRKKFILLNVAVGGGFPNGVAGYQTPTAKSVGGPQQGMEVDYVVVWST
ncbi:concanavalin A-like lectin/glucanase domain-containing protein [Microdochium bolleyi]|uniref:Concanavalin A-like lectin/glucanase domain-containing protein n=1 Tax=Microdochium bolleyi TaxID=196109 RepID=A0A136INS5_9PEZI|nr:concanavalin A-like lectin/glucanase domain-containing protein [Microdochium bolleyi]